MSKRKKRRKCRGAAGPATVEVPTWLDGDDIHMAVPSDLLPPEALGRLTEMWQAEIRDSPLWDQMVEEFGQEKAEELLKSFRAELW